MGDRTFTLDRMRQGFLTARHWDAFLAERDHAATCTDGCGQPGPAVELGDGSLQPTVRQCREGLNLFHAANAIADRDRRELAKVQAIIRRKRGL